MKLLFDTQIFDWQLNGGISRYFIELINRLDKDTEIEVLFKCTHSYNTYLQDTKWLKINAKLQSIDFKGKLRIVKQLNQIINRSYTNNQLKSQAVLFHPTYYDPYFLKKIGNIPFVLTVYDLTIEKFNDGTKLTQQVLQWKKELILKAAHIIAISANTKRDIISYYEISEKKITTIYLAGGFDLVEQETKQNQLSISKNYLLFVGSRSAYKNFNEFVREVAGLLLKYNMQLCVAGGGAFNTSELHLLKELHIENHVELLMNASDQELKQLYAHAMIFVFPSKYEGFGIPVLEAMQSGCPTLLSDNSSLPEVGGDAAAYFNPFLKGDLMGQLEKLILDEERRTKMRIRGKKQCAKFNWDITAAQHLQVYQQLSQKIKI